MIPPPIVPTNDPSPEPRQRTHLIGAFPRCHQQVDSVGTGGAQLLRGSAVSPPHIREGDGPRRPWSTTFPVSAIASRRPPRLSAVLSLLLLREAGAPATLRRYPYRLTPAAIWLHPRSMSLSSSKRDNAVRPSPPLGIWPGFANVAPRCAVPPLQPRRPMDGHLRRVVRGPTVKPFAVRRHIRPPLG